VLVRILKKKITMVKGEFTKSKVTVGKVAAHLCLTLIVEEVKISVELGRVVTTFDIIKH